MSDTDLQLLARYVRQNAEDAFAEIVRRHLDLVFSAAFRQVRSAQLAEEVVQSAFADLARQARTLAPDTILSAWLYQVTRRTAVDVVRRESRRQRREQIASDLQAVNTSNTNWTHVEPILDDAMQALDETDRAAILLRYFENKSLREVGENLGTNEDAARKRVTRAVERLRDFFTQRGVSLEADGLASAISTNAIQAAPAGLAASAVATVSKALALSAAAKGAATLASGGWLAMFGGLFISLKAHADDTKSPRERQFMVRVILIRVAVGLSLLAALMGSLKIKFSDPRMGHEAVIVAFLFVASSFATVALDHTKRRQRQIQIEEGTWASPEWTKPRHETDPLSSGNKALRFMAFGLVLSVILIFEGPWKTDLHKAPLWLAYFVLTLLLSFLRWRNRPRFNYNKLAGPMGMVYMCGISLLGFNLHQSQSWLGISNGTLPASVILFNLVVLLAYGAFIGIFLWKRKTDVLSSPATQL